jgi:hypothetical protein
LGAAVALPDGDCQRTTWFPSLKVKTNITIPDTR